MAVKLFAAMVHNSSDCASPDELKQISHRVHHDVVECGHLVGGENGIGTTFSAIRMLSDRCMFSHVGDSSIFTAMVPRQISKCHTLGMSLSRSTVRGG